jgi:hypothetical protein
MGRVFLWIVMLSLSLLGTARAQFKVETLLDKGPIRLSAGLDMEFNKFGQNVVVKASSVAALRNAQPIIDATIPVVNQNLTCASGALYSATIKSIAANSSGILATPSGSLNLTADATFVACRALTFPQSGDFTVSATIQPVAKNSILQLQLNDLRVQKAGITWIRIGPEIPLPQSVLNFVLHFVGPKLTQYVVNPLNNSLAKLFQNAWLRKQVNAYKLQIQSAQFSFQNSDLVVTVGLSGQVPIATVNRVLNF